MTEKLSEATWTTFTRKQKLDLDDAALVKALAKVDRTPDDRPEPRAQALADVVDEIGRQVAALAKRRKALGDKAFGEAKDKLHALLEAAEALHKEAAKAAAQAAKSDDDDGPAVLTDKLASVLREVRKGERVMQALVAVAGKETVVLVSRSAISPARGKLLKDQMINPSGLKFIRGECLFEKGVVTFAVQAPSSGLAKKIGSAVLVQTGLRMKVRVRGEDPNDVDQDGEDEESTPATSAARPAEPSPKAPPPSPAPTAPRSETPPSATASAAPAAAARADALAKWTTQRTAAVAALKAVAAKIASARHPSSAKAIVEIQAVIRNLTAAPSTLQQVTELQKWLGTDDVVDEVCTLAHDVRTPLLAALAGLRAHVA
jgi:hypothetical protein